MKKKIISLILSAAAALSVMPGAAVKAYDASDYYARNFIATENGVFWASCEQISWFNPVVEAEKISLYAKLANKADSSFELLGDDYDTTPNASVVTTLNTGNWQVTPRNAEYTFKLVVEFADGTVKEQLYDAFVPNDTHGNDWFFSKKLSDDFTSKASRGGWCYTMGSGNGYDIFPMAAETVYVDGNPALKMWSNAHINESTNETRDGKTNNSGNYYGDVTLVNSIENGISYDISFKYKAKGIENLKLKINNNEIVEEISDTNGEWENYSTTVTAATTTNLIDFHFQSGNEEFIIDDVVVKKTGTDSNILNDGDFSQLALSSPDIPEKAYVTNSGDNVIVSWKDITDGTGVNVYEVVDGTEIKRAYVKKGKTSATFNGNLSSGYVIKAVNDKGAESAGAECELPSYSDYEIAVINPSAFATGRNGEIVVSWQNSSCAAIKRVSVEDENGTIVADSDNPPADDNSNKDTISTTAEKLCSCTLTSYSNNEYHKFKIITETDFGSIEQTVTGVPSAMETTHELMVTDKTRMYLYRGSESVAFPSIQYEIENESGNNFLKVANHYPSGWMPSNTWVEFGRKKGEIGLKSDTKYKVELKYKGVGYAWQKIFIHDQTNEKGVIDIFTNTSTLKTDKWTSFSKTITTDSGEDTQGFRLYFGAASGGAFYVDDIKVTEVDTNTVVYSENFDSSVVKYDASVSNVTATAGDASAVIKWTAPENSAANKDLVKIFAESNGNKYLAATVDPSKGEYTLTGLSNEADYTFTVLLCDSDGHPSEAKTASATPEAPACKISNVFLCDKYGDKSEQSALTAGEYKVCADVKNNGMGSGFTAQLIVCLYDGDTLYEAKASKVTSIEQTSWKKKAETLLTDTFTVPSVEGHSFTLKAYIWDSLTGMNKLGSVTLFK